MENNNFSEIGKSYLELLTRTSSTLNWLFLSILIFTGVNFALMYQDYFGALNSSIMAREENISKEKIDEYINPDRFNRLYYQYNYEDSSNSAKKDFIKSRELKTIENYKDLILKNNSFTIPFLGITLYRTEFMIFILIIGVFFLCWLVKNIEYCRDLLRDYYNLYKGYNYVENELISSLFLYIFSGNRGYKFYRYFEFVLLIYSISIAVIVIGNIYEIVTKILPSPGFNSYFKTLLFGNLVFIGAFIVSFVYLIKSRKYLLNIRNIIILLRWRKRAIIPAIKEIFECKNKKLKVNSSYIRYDIIDNDRNLKLYVHLIEKKIGTNDITIICGLINLAESLKKFNKEKNHQVEAISNVNVRSEDYSFEDLYMINYFKMIITDYSYEPFFNPKL